MVLDQRRKPSLTKPECEEQHPLVDKQWLRAYAHLRLVLVSTLGLGVLDPGLGVLLWCGDAFSFFSSRIQFYLLSCVYKPTRRPAEEAVQ